MSALTASGQIMGLGKVEIGINYRFLEAVGIISGFSSGQIQWHQSRRKFNVFCRGDSLSLCLQTLSQIKWYSNTAETRFWMYCKHGQEQVQLRSSSDHLHFNYKIVRGFDHPGFFPPPCGYRMDLTTDPPHAHIKKQQEVYHKDQPARKRIRWNCLNSSPLV